MKSAELTLVEQNFHFLVGTHFRISTTLFWTKVTNSLLYDLIQAKETFESDHAYKLEMSISLLKNLEPLELNEILLVSKQFESGDSYFVFIWGHSWLWSN